MAKLPPLFQLPEIPQDQRRTIEQLMKQQLRLREQQTEETNPILILTKPLGGPLKKK